MPFRDLGENLFVPQDALLEVRIALTNYCISYQDPNDNGENLVIHASSNCVQPLAFLSLTEAKFRFEGTRKKMLYLLMNQKAIQPEHYHM